MGRASKFFVTVLFTTALGACDASGGPTATERLWISELPTSPRAPITAFVTAKARGDNYVGTFYQGTVLRGQHDMFQWQAVEEGRARLQFLQDGKTRKVRLESCKPTLGFDYCIVLHGDPTGVKRYQSRKRWTVRRGKAKSDVLMWASTLADLAEDDADIAALLAPEQG